MMTINSASTRRAAFIAIALMGCIGVGSTQPAHAEDVTAVRGSTDSEHKGFEIAARSDRSDRGYLNSQVELTMILRNAAGDETRRELSMSTLEVTNHESIGDKSLVIFRTPKDIEGTVLLSHAKILEPDDQWLFLPALKRVKRISSSNKSGPFVGSEFAFEDFTSLELNKYNYDWQRTEACGEFTCDVILRIPRYEDSGYSKQLAWIDQTYFQVRKVEFYDRRNSLFKTLRMEDYRNYDGVWRSHKLLMINHQTHKTTDLLYSPYQFKVNLTDNDFVKGRLSLLR